MASNKHLVLSSIASASHTFFLLLYVNDIVVTGSDSTHLQQFISLLCGHFDIKDLVPLSYFLGLQVLHKDGTLHINQLKYAHDLLQKANLLYSKPASTPLAAKVLLSISDGAFISNPTEINSLHLGTSRALLISASPSLLKLPQLASQPTMMRIGLGALIFIGRPLDM
ncbi:unnamed protein product [Prunus armeniaca]